MLNEFLKKNFRGNPREISLKTHREIHGRFAESVSVGITDSKSV